MDNNRYVAAWNDLKSLSEGLATSKGNLHGAALLLTVNELEAKHGIPNKEVKDASCIKKEG